MARYFLKRFLLTLPALWLVLTLVFLMIHIVPGDPVEQMLGEGAAPGQVTQLRHLLGLDLPLPRPDARPLCRSVCYQNDADTRYSVSMDKIRWYER